MIRVLIVDDSPAFRRLIRFTLEQDTSIQIVAEASSGQDAIKMTETHLPDVITMDLMMPDMDGLETTRQIMRNTPVPILIVTGDAEAARQSFRFLEAGALTAMGKPPSPDDPNFVAQSRALINTVKSLATIKVVKKISGFMEKPKLEKAKNSDKQEDPQTQTGEFKKRSKIIPQIIAFGASTGGPQTLKSILGKLSPNYPLPILVAQHIAPGFLTGLVSWLNEGKNIRAQLAQDGQKVSPSTVYFAPDDYHMGIDDKGRIKLSQDAKEYSTRPAVSYLFKSVVKSYGAESVGILLTGMGKDGAIELGLLKASGAITIAQSKESSVVHGMPGTAISLGNASFIYSPEQIVEYLLELETRIKGAIA